MSEQAQGRKFGGARGRAAGELASIERYRRSQRQARGGRTDAVDGPRPLEFDESGFPIAQRSASFAERVARMLSP
jgi:hypothetical protein